MTTRPIRLLVLYADMDDAHLRELEKHLSGLQRQQLIETWHRRRVAAGDDLAAQMDKHLEQADVILLGVSADFISSDYIHDGQLARAIHRHAAGSARVIPVIFRPVSWHLTSFGHLSPLPREGRAVETWPNKDEAWLEVVNEIERIAHETRQGLTLAAQNSSLRSELANVLARDQELILKCEALEKELVVLRDTHRRFDAEVDAATTGQRAAARSAQAQVAELTVRVGEALRDVDFYRNRADMLSAQRQDQLAQVARLTDKLKELRRTHNLLIWKSETQLYVVSGGLQCDSGENFTVSWALAVENIGRHAVRLIEAQAIWCFVDPDDASAAPIDLNTDPYVSAFTDRPMVQPGRRSETYVVKVSTKDIDPEHAKELSSTIQPRLRVIYEGVGIGHRSSSERFLEKEDRIPAKET